MNSVRLDKIPISKIQEQFYVLNILYPEHTSYHIPSLFKIAGIPSVDILEKSINTIISRHDSLRAVINSDTEGASNSYIDIKVAHIQIEEIFITEPYQGQQVTIIEEELKKPFELDKWPLFRVKLFVFENEISLLTIVFHHIIVDLHSKRIFARELSFFYNYYSKGTGERPKLNSMPYSSYAEWENEWLESSEAHRMLTYWKSQFSDSHYSPCLPTDFDRPAMGCNKGKRKFFFLGGELSSLIDCFAREQSLNTFTILLAAYTILIHKLSGKDLVVVGVPLSNRRKEEFKDTFGAFVNILPIHIDFSDLENGVDLVKQLRRVLLLAHRNQEIPFAYMVQNLNLQNSFSYNSIFQVGFTSEPPMKLELNGLDIKPLEVERMGSQLDLFCTFWQENGTVKGYMEYATDLFKESTIEKWIKEYQNTCKELVLYPLKFQF